jgi:hypothetical protein
MQNTNNLPKELDENQVHEIALLLRPDFDNYLNYMDSFDDSRKREKIGMTSEQRLAFIQLIKDFYQATRKIINHG